MELSSYTGSGKDHQSSLSTHSEVLPEEVEPSKEPSTKHWKEGGRKAVTTRRHDDDNGSDGDDESDGDEDLPCSPPTGYHVQRRKKAVTIRRHDDGDKGGALPHPAPTSSRPPVLLHRKKAQRHDDDSSDGDKDLPCSPPTGYHVQRRKKAVTIRRHDDGDKGGALPHPAPTSSHVQCRKKAQRHDDDDDDGDDGNKQPTNTTKQERVKKVAAKRKYHAAAADDDDGGDDGERQNVSSRRSTVQRLKTANETQHSDDDVSKVQTKQPWSVEERTAVQRRMAKFVALRKVPAKNDCLLCIGKEFPVLSTRTWKDVKCFVYNEILKVKKKLAF